MCISRLDIHAWDLGFRASLGPMPSDFRRFTWPRNPALVSEMPSYRYLGIPFHMCTFSESVVACVEHGY